ncbi:unnamed protein product [Periconia digitata]|uniref:Endosomal/vacuolar adapter protein YPT35 n=1 Tax=Periconia digitata TaxID=1303443 RepID=A0A9W4U494_9PLEO|nr:unnamed protein product [Periconia digitata]
MASDRQLLAQDATKPSPLLPPILTLSHTAPHYTLIPALFPYCCYPLFARRHPAGSWMEPVPDNTTTAFDEDADGGDNHQPPATIRPERNSLVPPYWQKQDHSDNRLSYVSLENGSRPTPIRLEDHTDEASEQHKALWAKHVSIDDYVIVGNSPAPAFGAYVVWTVTVQTLDGGPMKIMKRFSEFDDLRERLVKSFPHAASSMPPLPPKSVVCESPHFCHHPSVASPARSVSDIDCCAARFRPRFLERRRVGLAYFLNCILLNPEFAGSPVLKEFLFS